MNVLEQIEDQLKKEIETAIIEAGSCRKGRNP